MTGEGTIPSEHGSVRITDEVVSMIAGLAAAEVEGVNSLSGGIAGGIAEALGRKNISKGVRVKIGEEEAAIDLYLIVNYGYRIPDVTWNVQENVNKAVQKMTGLRVTHVNVHVQGVSFAAVSGSEEKQG